jgi:hypothetical protein
MTTSPHIMLVKRWFAYACFIFQLLWKNPGWVQDGGASEFSEKAYVTPKSTVPVVFGGFT